MEPRLLNLLKAWACFLSSESSFSCFICGANSFLQIMRSILNASEKGRCKYARPVDNH